MPSSFIDTRRYDGPSVVECDLCIIGGGAAGLTLAHELIGRGLEIVVVESGDTGLDPDTQALYDGKTTGVPYFDLASCRLRFFGGTTNHWGGFCHRNWPLNYQGRSDLGIPSWPMTAAELEPYVLRALAFLGIDAALYDIENWARWQELSAADLVEHHSSLFRSIHIQQSEPEYRYFAPRFQSRFEAREDTRVFLNCNVTQIQLNDAGKQVVAVRGQTLSGRKVEFRARQFVLACHAIENARLLLASNDIVTPGIGNEDDHVGRYFMDHLDMPWGQLIASEESFPSHYYQDTMAGRVEWSAAGIELTEQAAIESAIMAYQPTFLPRFASGDDGPYQALRRLSNRFFEPFDRQMAKDAATIVRDIPGAIRSGAVHMGWYERKPVAFDVSHRCAQAPNPDSRVRLVAERDRLGVPKVELNWALTELDVRTLQTGAELLVRELSALGFGRFVMPAMTRGDVESSVIGQFHHMGTTRMSRDARDGVVDPDSKLHRVANLYVAGSSVFPSGGLYGPTLHLIALTMRLADHLGNTVLI